MRKLWDGLKKRENTVWAAAFCVLLSIILSICFDFYYDLNDDVLMKDILAGVYTGVPEGHNIQMLYPVSLFISLFYRLGRGLPWYGIFLWCCQFGSLFLITKEALAFTASRLRKLLFLCAEAGLFFTLLLWEFVFVQYTVTCALLASAAAFRFYLSPTEPSTPVFVRRNLPSIVLAVLAFQIRSEMLALVLPLICVTGVCRWAAEKPVFTVRNAAKYFSVFGLILAGMLVSQGIHMAAYGSEEWKRFDSFFDSRTQLYDFLGVPPYEENAEFYKSIGLSESEQELLHNYNFGLDEEIDAALFDKLCEYRELQYAENTDFAATLKSAVNAYRYRTLYEDAPWNLAVIAMYVLVLGAALLNRHFRILWELPLLGTVRTGLWLFILYRGRSPIRITHSLYLMEFVILLALLLTECGQLSGKSRKSCCALVCLAAAVGITVWMAGESCSSVRTEYGRREAVNRELAALKEYVGLHEDCFYFLDVYSSVAYSEKLFETEDNSLSNYDIMGGWASKSPLMEQKYARFGIENMESALTEQDSVYMLESAHRSASLLPTAEWLPAYYEAQGLQVEVVQTDIIMNGAEEAFVVYRIQKQ